MANEKETDPTKMNLGDLSVIRNILMGQQMNEYDSRFTDASQRDQELQQNINELSDQTNLLIGQLEDNINDRLNKLEALMGEQIERVNDHIEAKSKSDRHALGKLLKKVSEQLLKD